MGRHVFFLMQWVIKLSASFAVMTSVSGKSLNWFLRKKKHVLMNFFVIGNPFKT